MAVAAISWVGTLALSSHASTTLWPGIITFHLHIRQALALLGILRLLELQTFLLRHSSHVLRICESPRRNPWEPRRRALPKGWLGEGLLIGVSRGEGPIALANSEMVVLKRPRPRSWDDGKGT